MKKEIREEVREFILEQVNLTLARLGVSEKVCETKEFEDKYNGTLHYKFESPAIHQVPMMFKRAYVDGYMVSIEVKENNRFHKMSENYDIVVVSLDYRWESFKGGSNGTDIGRMIFAVSKDLPESFERKYFGNVCELYVRKLEGLEL